MSKISYNHFLGNQCVYFLPSVNSKDKMHGTCILYTSGFMVDDDVCQFDNLPYRRECHALWECCYYKGILGGEFIL